MSGQRLVPVNMSHDSLVALLEDILAHVREHDSFEGSIEYLLPCPPAEGEPDPPAGSVDVRASYRIGNTMGQGSMRMVGQWADVPDMEPDSSEPHHD
jgi:hypothetical protein